jgi:hypothetical protein
MYIVFSFFVGLRVIFRRAAAHLFCCCLDVVSNTKKDFISSQQEKNQTF